MAQTLQKHNPDITGCDNCIHYKQMSLFHLCDHQLSVYKYADSQLFHTAQHMRQAHNVCGPDMLLRIMKTPIKNV